MTVTDTKTETETKTIATKLTFKTDFEIDISLKSITSFGIFRVFFNINDCLELSIFLFKSMIIED